MPTNQKQPWIDQLRRVALGPNALGLTDSQLLESFLRQGDEGAFEALVRRHGPMVFEVCRRVIGHRHDAEDAFQATFLVLARKAASIRRREVLPSWLYEVAYRIALDARGKRARRHTRERQVQDMPQPRAEEEETWQDLLPFLDQELSRLPDKYRVPIILCELEGRTRKEVARLLAIPEGTLSSRLAMARKLLAKRLSRHGLVVAGAVLGTGLGQMGAQAGLSTPLVGSTVKAALLVTAGKAATTGVISAQVAALTEGALKAMLLSKLKIATAVLLAVTVLGAGTGVFTYRTCGAEQRTATAPDENSPRANSPNQGKEPDNNLSKERQQRILRWKIKFNTRDGEDYSKRLQALGAILAIPQAGERTKYWVIRNLAKRPVQGEVEDLNKIHSIFWVENDPKVIQTLSQTLGLNPPPKHMIVFFPEYIEDELLRKELSYAHRPENEIQETQFDFVQAEHGWELKVTSQKGKEQPANRTHEEAAQKDLQKLQGAWILVAREIEGQRQEFLQGAGVHLYVLKQDIHIFLEEFSPLGKAETATTKTFDFLLKPDQTPRSIEIVRYRDGGPQEGMPWMRGIYRLKGDQLTICWSQQQTPTEFATQPGTDLVLNVFQRESTDQPKGDGPQKEATNPAPNPQAPPIRRDFLDKVRSVAFTPDGQTVATAGWDDKVHFWNSATGELERTLKAFPEMEMAYSVQLSPDGQRVAAGGGSLDHGGLKVLDAKTGKLLWRKKDILGSFFVPLVYCSDGRLVVSPGRNPGDQLTDVRLLAWDAHTGELQWASEKLGSLGALAVSRDGKTLATGSVKEVRPREQLTEIRLWEARTGKLLRTLPDFPGLGDVLSFSADGKNLAIAVSKMSRTGGLEGVEITLWDSDSGKLLRNLKESPQRVAALAFSPDGQWLASAGGEMDRFDPWGLPNMWSGELFLYETQTGKVERTLKIPGSLLRGVAFSPDGRTVAVDMGGGQARLWDMARLLEGKDG